MKKQLLHTLVLALIITSCGTYKSGTIFGGGFYGKNKVIETDHPEKKVIEPEVDLTESNTYETIEYETKNQNLSMLLTPKHSPPTKLARSKKISILNIRMNLIR